MEPREAQCRYGPIFIIGSGRSGTTLLRLMLNMHSAIRIPRESGFLIPLLQALPLEGVLTDEQLAEAFEIIRNHPRWPDWECSDTVLHKAIYGEPGLSLAGLIDRVYRSCAGMGSKVRWGDKTPKNSLCVRELNTAFSSCKFIHIVRDARDVYVSMKSAGWFEGSTRRISKYWAGMTRDAMQGRSLGSHRYMEIRYEDLVTEPEDVLQAVCSFLGIEMEPRMLEFHRTAETETAPWENVLHEKTREPVKADRVRRWYTEMSTWELLVLEAYAGDTMRGVGQVLSLPASTWAVSWALKGVLEFRFKLGVCAEKVRNRVGTFFLLNAFLGGAQISPCVPTGSAPASAAHCAPPSPAVPPA